MKKKALAEIFFSVLVEQVTTLVMSLCDWIYIKCVMALHCAQFNRIIGSSEAVKCKLFSDRRMTTL